MGWRPGKKHLLSQTLLTVPGSTLKIQWLPPGSKEIQSKRRKEV
jgi:hypothetical protein